MTASLGFGVLGAGRIGALHARHLAGAVDGAHLVAVMDALQGAAARAAFGNAYATDDAEKIFADDNIQAVLIASPTPQHAEQIIKAAEAGKAIFCEKPVALDGRESARALSAVKHAGAPFQIGFNRRFDPAYAELARAVHAGELGRVEMFRSQSSDPAPSPEAYIAASGGFYRDSVIHDLDMARFVAGDITRVSALGRVLVEPLYEKYGDVDTSIVTLEFESGAIGVLQNTRRTVYGYDLRVEVHGALGKLVAEDERATKLWRYTERGVQGDFYYFFLERFRDAYRLELQAFVDAVRAERAPSPNAEDATEALRAADAATRSLKEGRPVTLSEIQ